MNKQSMLVSIYQSIDQINWKTLKQKQKAVEICASIFNLYVNNGYSFSENVSLSVKYFRTIVPSNRDLVLKKTLIKEGILETDNSYDKNKGIGKGYRFCQDYFNQYDVSSTSKTFKDSNSFSKFTQSPLLPHLTKAQYLQAFYLELMKRLAFDNDVDTVINTITTITFDDLHLNQTIKENFLDILHGNRNYRYGKERAITKAHAQGKDLLQFKDNFYIDRPENFLIHHQRQLQFCYCQMVYNIENQVFYCNRNDTNNRLDYNLTGLKKELFAKLKFDGQALKELDIANAQFAIAAHINPSIDADFISLAESGGLYEYIERQLGLPSKEGKKLMFRIAFDKVKFIPEYNQIRNLFPKFMKWVDNYKKEHGYKMFANLLQKKEAEIMIDGLLFFLIEKGYEVFPIHDAIRVKESQLNVLRSLVNNYFGSIGFNCLVRQK